jgi:hypothetical protein
VKQRSRILRGTWRLLYLLPPYALGFAALFEPWARARVTLVWGVSRSPEAILLLALGLAIALGAGLFAFWKGRACTTALVHLGTGLLLGVVAYQAFDMVRDAGMRALGLLPLVSTRPGPGLRHFALAAALLVLLGAVELVIALWRRRARQVRCAA